jgi:hypothetical protein
MEQKAHFIVDKKHRERESEKERQREMHKGQGQDALQRFAPVSHFLQLDSACLVHFQYLPIVYLNFESINGLIH